MSPKAELRNRIRAARRRFAEKDSASLRIAERVFSLPAYRAANCALWYVDVRDEVRTRSAIATALSKAKSLVVPWCEDKELRLFRLRDFSELEPGRFGILEPKQSLRAASEHQVGIDEIEVTLVPGVAFDLRGGRLGHGAGFYDRFFASGAGGIRVALAYECQVVEEVPMADHDVRVDWLVTESRVWDCRSGLGVHADDSAC